MLGIEEGDSNWKQLGQTIYGKAVDNWSGTSMYLSAAGNTVDIGANAYGGNMSESDHVRVYHMDGTGPSWKQLGMDVDCEAFSDQLGDGLRFSPQMTRY